MKSHAERYRDLARTFEAAGSNALRDRFNSIAERFETDEIFSKSYSGNL